MNSQSNAERYPGVDFAYDLVGPSHEWMTARLEAIDSRLDSMQNLVATVTIAAPVLAGAIKEKPDFGSLWFIAAMGIFAAIVLAGITVRAFGKVMAFSPTELYAKYLHYDEWEFKKNLIYWGGKNFDANRRLISLRAFVANVMGIGFLAEAACLVVWVIR
ncbi:MAG: hypothetical protein AB7N24_14605 [Dehalococcoidia bacterium]